jgi:hypothetical protein
MSRKDAKGAKRYVLLFFCQKSLHTEITEIHRICSQFFFRQKNIRAYFMFTQRRKGREALCPFVLLSNKCYTQKSQNDTEFAPHASAKVCAVCVRP